MPDPTKGNSSISVFLRFFRGSPIRFLFLLDDVFDDLVLELRVLGALRRGREGAGPFVVASTVTISSDSPSSSWLCSVLDSRYVRGTRSGRRGRSERDELPGNSWSSYDDDELSLSSEFELLS